MIVSFDCPLRIKKQIDELIIAERYPDISTFCVAALENQLLLEETHSKESSAVREVAPPTKNERKATQKTRQQTRRDSGSNRQLSPVLLSTLSATDAGEDMDDNSRQGYRSQIHEFDLSLLAEKPPFPLPEVLPDMFRLDEDIPLERWLFGQYNRLLPAKVSLRALARIAMEGRDELQLESAAPRIAEVATRLGEYLRALDRQFGTHRDDVLATAFPESGLEGQKGRVRYQNQFVGHTVKGEQGGLLVGLKLALIQVHKNKPYILPTLAGWGFARIRNSILDDLIGTDSPPARLSEEDILFLVQHIKQHVPVERFAYWATLSHIAHGRNTPDQVNDGLARYLSKGKKIDDEQDFVSTQRSGVIGRMTDLGLVNRQREGTRITYHLTPRGKEFLEDVRPTPVGA